MAVPLTILTRRIPDPMESVAFSTQIRAAGGIAPYSWQVVAGFGSLPPGTLLSAAGVFSGTIPATAVGTYSFRLQVDDFLPTTAFLDYTIKVLPSGYDTVPDWLVDPVLRNLAGRLADDPIDREKAEIHFFRGIIGVMGDYYAHFDEDIYCPDWRVPGNNVGLRTVLEYIYVAAFGSVRTINTIPPDGTSNFTLQAGTGITLTPIVNGLEVSAAAAVSPVKHYSAAGIVNSMMELSLFLPSAPHLVQGWYHEPVSDRWYDISGIPCSGGKHLDIPGALISSVAMAPGWDNALGEGVLHVLWYGGGQWNMSRFQRFTMALVETMTLPGPFGNVDAPSVLMGPNDEVFVAFIDTNFQLWYAVLDSSDYTNVAPPFSPLTAVTVPPLTVEFRACANGPKLVGCMDARFAYGYIGCNARIGGPLPYNSIIIEFSSVPTGTWAPTGQFYQMPFGGTVGSFLDIIIDDAAAGSNLVTYGLDQVRAGANDNFDLWYLPCSPIPGVGSVAMPMPPAPGAWNIENFYPGANYLHGAVALYMQTGVLPPANVSALLGFVRNTPSMALGITRAFPCSVTATGIRTGAPSVSSSWYSEGGALKPDRAGYGESFFQRLYLNAGSNYSDLLYFDAYPELNTVIYRQRRYNGEFGCLSSPEVFRTSTRSPYPLLAVPSNTYHVTAEDMRPFVYFSDETIMYGDPLFKPEDLRMEYRPGTSEAVIVNNSLFSWDVRIDSIEVPAEAAPPNLLISCYQFSEAMKKYHDAATWFPSPSTIPGVQVNWTEAQVATTNVGGFQFDSYYSVTPGGYDLYSGSVAQGRYFADEIAGLSQDYTFVFRYNTYPSSIMIAEAAIRAALNNFLALTPPLPHGTGVNPNYYTLPEVDAILLTSFSTLYAGPPYDYYRYFLFTNTDGLSYEHGYFSQNYVDTGVAYGPHPASGLSIPVQESFTVTVPGVGGFSDFFTLSTSVTAARVYVNGIMYLEGIDWGFSGMNVIEYYNRALGGFVLTVGSVLTVDKWNL